MTPKIFIGIPMYSHAYPSAYLSIAGLCSHLTAKDIPYKLTPEFRDSVLPRARNNLFHDFLSDPTFTHFLSVETDVGFPPDAIDLYLEAAVPVIGAFETRKYIVWDNVVKAVLEGYRGESLRNRAHSFAVVPDPKVTTYRQDQPILCLLVTLGFTLIERRVIEEIAKTAPVFMQDDHPVKEIVRFGVRQDESAYYCEAGDLCRKARELGFGVFAHPLVSTSQMGIHDFRGCFLCLIGVAHNHPTEPETNAANETGSSEQTERKALLNTGDRT